MCTASGVTGVTVAGTKHFCRHVKFEKKEVYLAHVQQPLPVSIYFLPAEISSTCA
jgi:hypothetical protein